MLKHRKLLHYTEIMKIKNDSKRLRNIEENKTDEEKWSQDKCDAFAGDDGWIRGSVTYFFILAIFVHHVCTFSVCFIIMSSLKPKIMALLIFF